MITFKHPIQLGLLIPLAFFWLFLSSQAAFAQRPYTVEKPRERPSTEPVTIKTVPAQPSKGVLAIVLDPVINGRIIVKDMSGRIINDLNADNDGQAEIQLPRGKTYSVEASFPGYLSKSSKSKPLKNSEVIRLRLTPQFAKLVLSGLPMNAQVFINDQLRATADQMGLASINDLNPGDHALLIRHPEYNDYVDSLKGLEVGTTANWRISPIRVAKLTVQGPAGAAVFIDGAMQGKIRDDGTVKIDYELDRATERTISVELLGFQTWSRKELLVPGPRTIEVKLDPVVTSAGFSDSFDDLMNWKPPSRQSWELIGEQSKTKLRIKGQELGTLKDKIYRDVQEAIFTVWLDDGKGATWVVRADKEGRNYYLFHLAGPKSTTHLAKRFYTYLVKDGGTPERADTPTPVTTELNQGVSYTITIEISGSAIKHWITSNETGQKDPLGSWTDTAPTKDKFLYGTFGFRSLAGEIFTIDDFSLEPANDLKTSTEKSDPPKQNRQ